MNPGKSNEPIAPNPAENTVGAPEEGNEIMASARLGLVLLKLRAMEASSIEKGDPATKELTEVIVDLEGAQKLVVQEEENARIDKLTGLPNLRAFDEMTAIELSRFERSRREGSSYPLYAVRIDLDHFKSINDTFGHSAGNLYLKTISDHMDRALRGTDILARVGGDEFVVLMPGLKPDRSEELTKRLLKVVSEGSEEAKATLEKSLGRQLNDKEGNVSASMGFALFDGEEKPDELFARADYYSYIAKEVGKNAVVDAKMAAELDPNGEILKRFISSPKDVK